MKIAKLTNHAWAMMGVALLGVLARALAWQKMAIAR